MSPAEIRKEMFEVMLEEHTKLRGLLSALEQMLADRLCSSSELAARLREVDELVDSHFHGEEDSGCFPNLMDLAPRVAERVKDLIGEHGELRAAIHLLVEAAGRSTGTSEDWEGLTAGFRDFAAKLLQHERTENELVQEVFTEDLGSKD